MKFEFKLSIIMFCSLFFVLGRDTLLNRRWFELDKEHVLQFTNHIETVQVAILLCLSFIIFFLFDNLLYSSILISAFCISKYNVTSTILRLSNYEKSFLILNIIQPIIYMSTFLTFLYFNKKIISIEVLIHLYTMCNVILLLIALKLRPDQNNSYRKENNKFFTYLNFSTVMFLNALLGFALFQLGRYSINDTMTDTELGMASVIYRIVGIQMILAVSITQALLPDLFKSLSTSSLTATFPPVFKQAVILNIPVAFTSLLACYLAALFFSLPLTSEFQFFILFFVVGAFLYACINYVNYSILKREKPLVQSAILLLSVIINVILLSQFRETLVGVGFSFFISCLVAVTSFLMYHYIIVRCKVKTN